jgi:hypothetical protein
MSHHHTLHSPDMLMHQFQRDLIQRQKRPGRETNEAYNFADLATGNVDAQVRHLDNVRAWARHRRTREAGVSARA